jgi:hypothetical protein
MKSGRVIELNKGEHCIITPDSDGNRRIPLTELPGKPGLLWLKPMSPTTYEQSEHLKSVRDKDKRYVAMMQEADNIRFDVTPEAYMTEVQQSVAKVEQMARKLAHIGAYDEEAAELFIAAVSSIHAVQEHLQDPEKAAHRAANTERIIAQLPMSSLSEVCARCERQGCIPPCTNACHTCGNPNPDTHTENCPKRKHTNATIYVLSETCRRILHTQSETENIDEHTQHKQAQQITHVCPKKPSYLHSILCR